MMIALQSQRAALEIVTRVNAGPVSADIAAFYNQLALDQECAERVAPLIKLVLTEAKDEEVWTTVFDLVTPTTRASSPAGA